MMRRYILFIIYGIIVGLILSLFLTIIGCKNDNDINKTNTENKTIIIDDPPLEEPSPIVESKIVGNKIYVIAQFNKQQIFIKYNQEIKILNNNEKIEFDYNGYNIIELYDLNNNIINIHKVDLE